MTAAFTTAPADAQLRALAGQLRHDATMTSLDTVDGAAARMRRYAELLDQVAATLTDQETP
ncbi:hypothetical protein [Rhodococcus zopfii]|uniref:hypothetical protein n=1 Tax=Rhodococcus zopfii TaxID=43772 RepID=UPI00093456A4|nr:hypothetical protein [Rhodococcus zopfii]